MRHNLDGYQRQAHLLVLAHVAARELVAWAGATIHPVTDVGDRSAPVIGLDHLCGAAGRNGAQDNLRSAPLGALRRRDPGPWQFFTHDEAVVVGAIVQRLVSADELSMGGKEAGCAVFIDRQLSGPFGDCTLSLA
jgi:hypothetical protein